MSETNSSNSAISSSAPPTGMLDLQLEAVADAVGAILAQQRREWSLEHAAFVAEHRAALADLRREYAESLAAIKAAFDEKLARMDVALANVKNGEPGPPGPPGESIVGPQGERGIGIAAIVRDGSRLFFEIEDGRTFDVGEVIGERGEKGEPGQEGPAGRDGRDGLPGVPGANGERGLDGKDGRDGIDGKDGLGFDDLEMLHDGERGFTFRLARDGVPPKEWTFRMAAQIYRGVYKEGERYERGDTVTWDGMVWHCNEPTNEPPRESKGSSWTLAVKQGRKGASAYHVACAAGFKGTEAEWIRSLRGPPGPEGRAGRDLTQIGPDGSKW